MPGGSILRSVSILLLLSGFSFARDSNSAASTANLNPVPDLPVWSTTEAQPNRYISAHGIRGFAGGYSEDGLEFWTFPLQLVNGYHLSFMLPQAAPVSAITILNSVEVDSLGITRTYTAPDFRVRERITTYAEDSGVVVRFFHKDVVTFTFRFNFTHRST